MHVYGFRELYSAIWVDFKVASERASPDESSDFLRWTKLIRGGMKEERSLRGNKASFGKVREVKLIFAFNIGHQGQAVRFTRLAARPLKLQSRRDIDELRK